MDPASEFNPQLHSGAGQKTEFSGEAVPGSRASTVHPGAWWGSAFRFCMKLGGSFGQFLRSFHRKPSSSAMSRGTATFWPMPLPYPQTFRRGASEEQTDIRGLQFKKGVNLAVASLNWLHLRRPFQCPEEICLFQPLTKVQWRIVKFMEEVMIAWSVCEPVTAEAMGRSASKVEDIESALGRLASLELDVGVLLEESAIEASGSPCSSRSRFNFAPGLQRESAGEVFGTLDGGSPIVAKKIVASRLEFKGEPTFNPSPFLDSRSKRVFECPIAEALKPGEAREDPPCVRIFGKQEEVWQLIAKLDSTGRLGVLRECDVLEGYQAGLFSVGKSSTHDRLIFDSRPFNTLELPLRRWIGAMGAGANLCDIHLAEGEALVTCGTDLREFYYSFKVGEERLRRNALLLRVMPAELRGFRCHDPQLEKDGRPVVLGLRTLAMGDSMAVELAQTAHLGILVQLGMLDETNLLAMGLPPPRESFFGGVVIDDLILFEKIARSSLGNGDQLESSEKMSAALARYKELGLIPHEGKTFCGSVQSEFWGASLDGEKGLVRANLKRVIPVVYATLGILRLGVCTVSLLEILVGCWTSIFLFKRRLLSVLNVCYEALQRQVDRRSVIRLSQALKEELLLVVALAPLAATFLAARDSSYLYESDASTWGVAVCRARLPQWLRSEIHRHRLRKQVWSKLLSPSRSLLRIKGLLPPVEELPGDQTLASHPLHIELGTCLQFEEVEKRAAVRQVHINVLELRGLVRSERRAAMEHFPSRSFSLSDSQVALGAWLKGRSASLALNQELQQSLPIHLGCGMSSNSGYIPSEVNVSDDPTRHRAVRKAEKSPEAWMIEENFSSLKEQLECFDQWLRSYGADPYSVSGLPDMDELREPVNSYLALKSRSKLYFEKNKAAAKCRKCKRSEVNVKFNSVADTAFPGSANSSDVSLPCAASLGRSKLSDRAQQILRSIPLCRFLLPRDWVVPADWRPDFAGYLDLYSGKKGVARLLVSLGLSWGITFETSDDAAQDVLDSNNRELIESLLNEGCVFGIGAAIFCGSFSRAVRPPVRSRLHVLGVVEMSQNMREKVDSGNRHASWLSSLIRICLELGIWFWVENPDSSFLWLLDDWRGLGSLDYGSSLRIDYCVLGCRWRKRTRIFTNTHLKGQCRFCSRDHLHQRLVGWSKCYRAPWTRVAQVYPRRLCWMIATALLIDGGILKNKRRVNVSAMAKVTNARIGEASNPGPRRRTGQRRQVDQLDYAELVEPVTSVLAGRVWESFRFWSLRCLSEESFDALIHHGPTLCIMVENFGRALFEKGDSIYILRQLITLIQRWKPEFRSSLGKAWQLVSKWETLEPSGHRHPLPPAIFQAMVVVSYLWGWHRFAGIVVLTYESISRPGETLRATRSDLLLPSDLLVEDPSTMFVRFNNPKSKRRGLGRVQHSKITDGRSTRFISKIFGDLPNWALLYPGSAASFRRRWDKVLQALAVPASAGLTPASMRGGGAVRAYRANEDVTTLLWRMRLKNLDTLQHYLQEAGAISLFASLPSRAKARVQSATSLYSSLLDGI